MSDDSKNIPFEVYQLASKQGRTLAPQINQISNISVFFTHSNLDNLKNLLLQEQNASSLCIIFLAIYFYSTKFVLDDTGDVTWCPENEDSAAIPLFSCETYEIYSTNLHGVIIRFGAYAEHIIEFRVSLVKTIIYACVHFT